MTDAEASPFEVRSPKLRARRGMGVVDPMAALSPSRVAQVGRLDTRRRRIFRLLCEGKLRALWSMELLAVLFPIQLFLLEEVELGTLFVVTGGGLGVWWVVEWFLTPRRVRQIQRPRRRADPAADRPVLAPGVARAAQAR